MNAKTVPEIRKNILVEDRLCVIWARYDRNAPARQSWLDCSTELTDIACVLASIGVDADVLDMFHEAADLAFARLIHDIQQPREAA